MKGDKRTCRTASPLPRIRTARSGDKPRATSRAQRGNAAIEFPCRVVACDDLISEVAASSDPTTHHWRARLPLSRFDWLKAPSMSRDRGPAGAGSSTKRWLIAALAAVIAPKCLLCLAGYLAVGGAAVELCGGAESESRSGAIMAVVAGCVIAGALVFSIWRKISTPRREAPPLSRGDFKPTPSGIPSMKRGAQRAGCVGRGMVFAGAWTENGGACPAVGTRFVDSASP
jgi:hypothetical protein